ncbi:hypothetical protein Tsubulata_037932, partial [Turnera subulata]
MSMHTKHLIDCLSEEKKDLLREVGFMMTIEDALTKENKTLKNDIQTLPCWGLNRFISDKNTTIAWFPNFCNF